jgi:hypothetical protein
MISVFLGLFTMVHFIIARDNMNHASFSFRLIKKQSIQKEKYCMTTEELLHGIINFAAASYCSAYSPKDILNIDSCNNN